MSAGTDRSDRLSWTALGVRMGFTSKQTQREELLAAIEHMSWTETPARPPYFEHQAVRAVAAAVLHHGRDQLRGVGIAHLPGGRQLIGVEDSIGTRSYLLDLDSEAIYVLAEFAHPLTTARPATARPATARPRGTRSPEPLPIQQRERLRMTGRPSYTPEQACARDPLVAAAEDPHRHLLAEVIAAYRGNAYRLLSDLADQLQLSIAYVDRDTVEAHLERALSDAEWAAVNEQFTAMDFDDHIGDQGRFRTDWIETILDKAGVPGYGYPADCEPEPPA